jgi:hypothetical protein
MNYSPSPHDKIIDLGTEVQDGMLRSQIESPRFGAICKNRTKTVEIQAASVYNIWSVFLVSSLKHHSMIYNIWSVFLVSSLNQFQILIEFYHGLAHQFNDSML